MEKGKILFGVFLAMFLSFFVFDKASAMTLTEDWTLTEDTSESITVPVGSTVTIDLNGHTITNPNASGGRTIVNRGTMTIKGNGTITNLNSLPWDLWILITYPKVKLLNIELVNVTILPS